MLATGCLWSSTRSNKDRSISYLYRSRSSPKESWSLLLNWWSCSFLSLEVLFAIFFWLHLNSIWAPILFTCFIITPPKVNGLVVTPYVVLFAWSQFSVVIWGVIHLILLWSLIATTQLAIIECLSWPCVLKLAQVMILYSPVLLFELTCHGRIFIRVTSRLLLGETFFSLVWVVVQN